MSRQVIIIGAGAAGLSAARELAKNNIPSVLVAQMPSERAQSVMAEGGINAALDTLGEGDTTALHAEDTLEAGANLADPAAVRGMTEAAPSLVEELAEQGLMLNRTDENRIDLRAFGGQKKKRTAYADACTGKQLMHTLTAQVRRYEGEGLVTRMTGWHFLELLQHKGQVSGCRLYHRARHEVLTLEASAVIVAAGGLNGLFGNATGSLLNTGAVTAMLFAAGIPLANGEMIQYHPTTAARPGKNMLITEAVRAEGGRLYVEKEGHPYYFMEDRYPDKGNLMPRDVVSREEWKLMQEGHAIYLDMTGLGIAVYQEKLSNIVEACSRYLHLDVTKQPIRVEPGIHYFMGGIAVDACHRTVLHGLYAAGECACQYHGANRLGGNSLLGALYGGKTAAISAEKDLVQERLPAAVVSEQMSVEALMAGKQPVMHLPSQRKALQAVMRQSLGIIRDEGTLKEGIRQVKEILRKAETAYDPDAWPDENYVWEHQCRLALSILCSACERKESRGAHQRSDYPEERSCFQKTTIATYDHGQIRVSFQKIGSEYAY